MLIYLVICNYNAGKHLGQCLNSVEQNIIPEVHISVVDNNSIDSSVELINSKLFINQKILLDKNIGKAAAINTLIKNLNTAMTDDDLIFSLDSDIKLISPDFFKNVLHIWSVVKGKVSCLVCNQVGNSLFKRKFQWTNSKKGFHYFAPSEGYGAGIAGGALIIPYSNWKKIGGYRMNRGKDGKPALYGGIDGGALLDLFRVTKLPICVIKELEVYHPPEENKGYQKWKDKVHEEHRTFGRMVSDEEFFKKNEI